MKSKMKDMPFMYRLLTGCLLIALVPLLLSNFLMIQLFNASLQTQAQDEAERQLAELEQKLGSAFENCDGILAGFAQNQQIMRAFIDNGPGVQNEAYLSIYKTTNGLHYGAEFALYDVGGKLRFSTGTTNEALLPVHWGILHKAGLEDAKPAYYGVENFSSKTSSVLFRMGRTLTIDKGASVGFAVASFGQSSFDEMFSGVYGAQSSLIVLDAAGRQLYTSHPGKAGIPLEVLQGRVADGWKRFEIQDTSVFVAKNSRSGFYLLLQQPKPLGYNTMQTMWQISLATAGACLLLSLGFALIFSRSLSRPISALTSAMGEVKAGKLETRIDTARRDELGILTENFNRMASDLQLYMNQTIQHQQEMNESQIRLLQAQLNPHFLYNTLDTVKWLAKMHNVPEIATITSNLAIILRQCVSHEDVVTLRQELDMVESYIDIQRIRFSGRFKYVVDVPVELEDCLIPKLILQPMVENAIIHGLADKNDGYIYIYAFEKEENMLAVSVTDDGCGMTQQAVDRLNSGEVKIVEGHLGLYNVSSIIKMNYGNEYGLRASSQQEVGTTMAVEIPLQKEGDHA